MNQPKCDAKIFMKRFKSAKALRDSWRSVLEDAYELFLPNRQNFNSESKGQSKTDQLFNDCGVISLGQFANNIKTKLMPISQRWALLEPSGNFKVAVLRGEISEEDVEVVEKRLDADTDIMFHYIWNSNFDTAAIESIKDMGISVGALMIQDTGDLEDPLNFISVPSDQLAIEESPTGDVKSVWREWSLKAREIDDMWPNREPDARLDRHIKETPEKDISIVEGTVWDAKEQTYKYAVHVNVSDRKIIYEVDYEISPWVIFRWEKTPSETWGRGPALNSLHTMSVLNQFTKDMLAANAMELNPIAVVNPNAIINPHKISFTPGSRILLNSSWNGSDGKLAVDYLTSKTNLNLADNFKAEYEQDIKDAFYLVNLPSVNDGSKTATEYNIRQNLALEQQNAAFTRLQKELIGKVIARVQYILGRYNLVTPIKVDGVEVSVKATSPLAKYQDSLDLQNVQQYVQNMIATFGEEIGPSLIQSSLKVENVGEFVADKMGLPSEIRLSAEERAKVLASQRDAAEKQQQALAQQQAMPEQQG